MLAELLIAVLIVGLLVGLALYVIDLLPLPSSFGNVAKVLVLVLAIAYIAERFLA